MPPVINSGIRIIDFIEILYSGVKSKDEICQKLKSRGIITEPKVVEKYFRTLKKAGFEIEHSKNKEYQIIKAPFFNILPQGCAEAVDILIETADLIFPVDKNYAIKDILKRKLLGLTGRTGEISLQKPQNNSLENLSNYSGDFPVNAEILYKRKNIPVIIRGIKYAKNGVFLVCTDRKTDKKLFLKTSFVAKIVYNPLPLSGEATIFKLTGKLKNSYILRRGERARYTEDEVYIINESEDKEMLFDRLVKYSANCEIVLPEKDREKFKARLLRLIKHYKSM